LRLSKRGSRFTASEAAAIQNISREAGKDLNLLQALYDQYKPNPDKATLAKIQGVWGHQPELAGAFAGGSYQQSHVVDQSNSGSELDLEHGDEFYVADASAGCSVNRCKTDVGNHGRSACEGFKEAMERAGMRADGQFPDEPANFGRGIRAPT
jgi:hypothetical protein